MAIGSCLMVMVYAGGHISGGHYSPALTLGVWLRGRCARKDVSPYWIAQILGAVVASLIVAAIRGEHTATPMKLNVASALLAELLFTFALVFVVLNVATAKATSGNSYFGLAIGLTVTVGAVAVGGTLTNAAFNPAVAVGISIMGLSAWGNLWIFLLANLAGGAVAASVFKLLNPQDP